MVKKIDDAYSLEEMRSEVLFSRAALKADPNASDFLPSTGSWLGIVATAADQELAARTALVEATASRTIANQRLDETCRDVGRALAAELKNDRSGARWSRLFHGTRRLRAPAPPRPSRRLQRLARARRAHPHRLPRPPRLLGQRRRGRAPRYDGRRPSTRHRDGRTRARRREPHPPATASTPSSSPAPTSATSRGISPTASSW